VGPVESTAVRQTPLTATESPTPVPSSTSWRSVTCADCAPLTTAVTSARPSTIPVNIASPLLSGRDCGDPHVAADAYDVGQPEPRGAGDRGHADVAEHGRTGPEQRGRVVADDAVDEPLADERCGQPRAAFDEHDQRVASEQRGKQRPEVESPVGPRQLDHLGAAGAQRLDPLDVGVHT